MKTSNCTSLETVITMMVSSFTSSNMAIIQTLESNDMQVLYSEGHQWLLSPFLQGFYPDGTLVAEFSLKLCDINGIGAYRVIDVTTL